MDRSRQFQAAVGAAVHAGMAPDDLETLMRKYHNGCASKYLESSDRLRAEIDRSYEKVKGPAEEQVAPDPDADGAVLLNDVHAFLARFVIYPSEEAHLAHTLWIAHTHLMDHWESTPRLAFLSAEPESGKTRALEISGLLVPTHVDAINVSAAYLFRKVADASKPTILFDEIDTVFSKRPNPSTEEVRGMLNAGHRRGATAGRCVTLGNTVETVDFPAYAAVAVAGLGELPDSILSRAIIIRMARRAPGERVEPFRARLHTGTGHVLRDRLIAWAKGAGSRLTGWPILPDTITDRAADCWEPLIAVADLAGGRWPDTSRRAAVALVARLADDRREASLGLRLLADMRVVFGVDEAKTTVAILDRLAKLDESPWADIKGKPLTDLGLARRLRGYGIRPKVIRVGGATPRGYRREDFVDAWSRYLPPAPLE